MPPAYCHEIIDISLTLFDLENDLLSPANLFEMEASEPK